MKASAYVETTIVSYLTSRPSRDLIRAAEQELTRQWWATRSRFDLYTSALVRREAAAGDPQAAQRRLDVLLDLPEAPMGDDVVALADRLLQEAALPQKAAADALHIAVAVVHRLDYLVTWNCTHIANAAMRAKIEAVVRGVGLRPTIICTPMELLAE